MSVYKAEYIWIDGSLPTAKLRCKTRVLAIGEEPPVWGFDGSSTNQAEGHASDCVLKPVFSCPDPVRGGADILVMCEVMLIDGTPHPSNTRAKLAEVAARTADLEMWYGIEQEYTFFDGIKPLGWPDNGFPLLRAVTTAALALMRSTVVRSSRRTSRPASRLGSASAASTPR